MKVLEFKSNKFDVYLQSTDIGGAWQRFKGRTKAYVPREYAKYTSNVPCSLFLFDPDNNEVEEKKEGKIWENVWPVVFETNKYQITIKIAKVDKGTLPRVKHVRREVEEMFFADEDQDVDNSKHYKNYKITGNVDFLNEPGVFRLELEYFLDGKKENVLLTWDVVSPKLDTKHDYASIIRQVNKEYENIVFRYLSTTYQQFTKGRINNDVVWLNTFEGLVDHYLRHVSTIINQPRTRVSFHFEQAKADHIKRWTPRMEERYAEVEKQGKLEEKYFCYNVQDSTVDTMENRFVKHTVKALGTRLSDVFNRILKAASLEKDNDMAESRRKQLQGYVDKFQKLSHHPFFRSIGRWEGMTSESLLLQSRQGYMQVYKDWLKLRRGIDLYNGAANIGTLQIWEIYELWCFVKMKQMIREVLHIPATAPLYEQLVTEPKVSMLNPFTDCTLEHTVEYRYPTANEADLEGLADEERQTVLEQLEAHRNDIVTLHYQHTFNRRSQDDFNVHTATTEQRPDMVVNIRKGETREIMLTYLYDAKYRVVSDSKLDKDFEQSDVEEQNEIDKGKLFGADYPPSDAINQMHRYRDAIYYGSELGKYDSKEIIGGYILFPGRGDDESIDRRYFSESIRKVNIGAFPLTPNKDESKEGPQLRKHFTEILMQKAEPVNHVESAIPQRGLKYEEDVPISPFLLIGFISHKDLSVAKEQSYYYVRAFKENRSFELIQNIDKVEYVLLHTNLGSRIVYKIKGNPEFISGRGLQDKGFHTDGTEHDMYLGFKLDTSAPASVPFDPYEVKLPPIKTKPYYSPKVRTLDNPNK